jgi:hypothetical protein
LTSALASNVPPKLELLVLEQRHLLVVDRRGAFLERHLFLFARLNIPRDRGRHVLQRAGLPVVPQQDRQDALRRRDHLEVDRIRERLRLVRTHGNYR